MSSPERKTITLVANKPDVVEARRRIAAYAFERDLRVVSLTERRRHLTTELVVTVAGHPRRIREFHDAIRGNLGEALGSVMVEVSVDVFRAVKRKWQGRKDPPLEEHSHLDVGGRRATVYWKWQAQGDDGEGVGPVWVETYARGQVEPVSRDDWPQWVRRSEASAYAREHGHLFLPDE